MKMISVLYEYSYDADIFLVHIGVGKKYFIKNHNNP